MNLLMPSENIAISARNLTKRYRIFGHSGDRMKQAFTLGRIKFHREFEALNDVSFDIMKGESVGIVGRNGSGKSTLLQLICGILKPTSGSVQTAGAVSALLELGAGFNPEFTGRENVYFQGALVGFSKAEMESRFDAIVGFADIGDFIDQPVRTYSSGMYVRLAFALAVHSRQDILVVDEALAVGDSTFQRKCFRSATEFVERGGTVIYVSHDIESVRRFCSRAILIDKGRVISMGPAKNVCDQYEKSIFDGMWRDETVISDASLELGVSGELHYGGELAMIERCWIENQAGAYSLVVPQGEAFSWNLQVSFRAPAHGVAFSMMLKTPDGWCIYGADTECMPDLQRDFGPGEQVQVSFRLDNRLLPGTYHLNCGVRAMVDGQMSFLHRRVDSGILRISQSVHGVAAGVMDMRAQVTIQHNPST